MWTWWILEDWKSLEVREGDWFEGEEWNERFSKIWSSLNKLWAVCMSDELSWIAKVKLNGLRGHEMGIIVINGVWKAIGKSWAGR